MEDYAVSGAVTLLSAFGSLIVVLLLAYYLLKWTGRRMPSQNGSRYIRILDRAPLAPDKSLVLVRVADKTLLVGVSPQQVQQLCELEDPDGTLFLAPECAPDKTFAQALEAMREKLSPKKGEDA